MQRTHQTCSNTPWVRCAAHPARLALELRRSCPVHPAPSRRRLPSSARKESRREADLGREEHIPANRHRRNHPLRGKVAADSRDDLGKVPVAEVDMTVVVVHVHDLLSSSRTMDPGAGDSKTG